MNTPAANVESKMLSEGERSALVSLLADDDAAVYQTVRSRLISFGPAARDWVRPHLLSGDPLLRRRSREIVCHFGRQEADNRFLSFCLKHGEDFSIEEATWLLAQAAYPDINVEAYQAMLDGYAEELRTRLEPGATAKDILRVINQYLFKELGFAGNAIAYYDPENSYLNRVMDRRTGNPITLSLLYLLISRRLQLPVAGVGLPGHFICRYQSASEEVYLDAFNQGKMMNKADCVQFLSHLNPGQRDEFLQPASARRIVLRMCNNLNQIYRRLAMRDEATRLHRYVVALEK